MVINNFIEPTIIANHIRVYPIISEESCGHMCGLKIALTGCNNLKSMQLHVLLRLIKTFLLKI